jgi:hypothetical protein
VGSRPARHRYCRCGTHLATDNTERQCARCQRTSRDKLIAPPQVPAHFWQTEQLQEAFSAQHIGRVARAYRTHPHHHTIYGPNSISQTLLGHWLSLLNPKHPELEGASALGAQAVAAVRYLRIESIQQRTRRTSYGSAAVEASADRHQLS